MIGYQGQGPGWDDPWIQKLLAELDPYQPPSAWSNAPEGSDAWYEDHAYLGHRDWPPSGQRQELPTRPLSGGQTVPYAGPTNPGARQVAEWEWYFPDLNRRAAAPNVVAQADPERQRLNNARWLAAMQRRGL